MSEYDLVIINGSVFLPSHSKPARVDIGVKSGRITRISRSPIDLKDADEVFNAEGLLISAGWIDIHTHLYQHATPLGVNPDESCLLKGVTTAVDAGSAGCGTINGLRKFIAEKSQTRVFAFIHLAGHGLANAGCAGHGTGGESDAINALDVDSCVEAAKNNSDFVVGIKLRLDRAITDNGRNEIEAYRRAKRASKECDLPLMIHHTNSTIPLSECPGSLAKGDIYTHTFHGHRSTISENGATTISCHAVDAKARGVVMDVGHGKGSFDWKVAEAAAKVGFHPDTISTDLHLENIAGPVKNLAFVMSKFLHLGMPLNEIIDSVTTKAAKAINKEGIIGLIALDREADLTVFQVESDLNLFVEDSFGEERTLEAMIGAKYVVRAGKLIKCDT